jgi:hypothetical protein
LSYSSVAAGSTLQGRLEASSRARLSRAEPGTVNSLLTHTPKNRPSSMRYQGVWDLREGTKISAH